MGETKLEKVVSLPMIITGTKQVVINGLDYRKINQLMLLIHY